MTNIDYSKYSNKNSRELLNYLLKAQEKQKKLKAEMEEKIKQQSMLVNFLKAKVKESIDTPNLYTLETSPIIQKHRQEREKIQRKQNKF
ncbi:hypothetical protein [Helicobacter sp. 11S02629-2]|uniref:hypothetical protein n=1 Tax=Helicobacter sp. 11S02629-2 TaxID=1476195 RepID=UPI000BA79E9F|nr:hypothetical protein [Helicobacter sp. 11S02629-2]PAF45862.1 hypothetical protein BKH40_00140 [Helicobacter sp. 11S02629-2]